MKQKHDYLKTEIKQFKESVQANMTQFYSKATETIEELKAKLQERNSVVTELSSKLESANETAKHKDFLDKENKQLIEARSFQ